mmetsp:Transcript_3213/g.7006  ORF Transcript_3213/g.7006 Transcript_3213/m.7006 type:complete len:117 (+) Transcript_3213:568-918(+)
MPCHPTKIPSLPDPASSSRQTKNTFHHQTKTNEAQTTTPRRRYPHSNECPNRGLTPSDPTTPPKHGTSPVDKPSRDHAPPLDGTTSISIIHACNPPEEPSKEPFANFSPSDDGFAP